MNKQICLNRSDRDVKFELKSCLVKCEVDNFQAEKTFTRVFIVLITQLSLI